MKQQSPSKRYRKNYNNIYKERDKYSQDFISFPMINFFKYCQRLEIYRWFNNI